MRAFGFPVFGLHADFPQCPGGMIGVKAARGYSNRSEVNSPYDSGNSGYGLADCCKDL